MEFNFTMISIGIFIFLLGTILGFWIAQKAIIRRAVYKEVEKYVDKRMRENNVYMRKKWNG